jgi:hypothetical protein
MTDPILEAYGECTPQGMLNTPLMKEKILNRLDKLNDIFKSHFAKYKNIKLDMFLLRETIESCFCDIYRLKFFRNVHQEDAHKQAAFFMIWIAKIRPIQFMNEIKNLKPSELFANELFAIFTGLALLDISPRCLRDREPEYFRNLIYLLHFHSCSGEQLASEMFLLDRLFTLPDSTGN